MRTIGTAGHVDHGKSSLVKALTGVDPDRLREEKERGLTIELGFARLDLPGGGAVSVVDVPGHERFIKTMLAGVGGIDLALLVVAADDGVMPQTREHLSIIDILGIRRGIVALTKSDLVDAARLAAAAAQVRDLLTGTALALAPLVPCSAQTGEGLDELARAIERELELLPDRPNDGRPRLPVDRAFSVSGFGAVVTGTLAGGALSAGDDVELQPGGLRARVRGIQVHGEQVSRAEPGGRTAVNLAGLAAADVRRGMVLARPGDFGPVSAFDASLRAAPYLTRPVRHNLPVSVHLGSAEAPARLLLLDGDTLGPGASGWAQLKLMEPLVAVPGDRFIVRDANDTLGGGRVIAVDPPRRKRRHPATLALLEALARGEPPPAADDAAPSHRQRLIEMLRGYHAAHPARPGMPRAEAAKRLDMAPQAFEALVSALAGEGKLAVSGPHFALPDHAPSLSPQQRAAADAYLARLAAQPYAPPTDSPPDGEVLAYLEQAGEVVRAGQGVVFTAQAFRQMAERVTARLRERGSITLAEVRDMFGTTRKYAQPLLERMDAMRITRRVGDVRVLASERALPRKG